MKQLTILTCVGLTFVGLAANISQAAHELKDRDLDRGKALYADNCASCHGTNLEGQPNWRTPDEAGLLPAPPHDETGHTWHHDNNLLFRYTKLGGERALAESGVTGFKSGMPGFEETLNDGEIWSILAYIRSKWPEHIQENHFLRNPPHN